MRRRTDDPKGEVPLLGHGIGYALGAVLLATSGTLLALLHAAV